MLASWGRIDPTFEVLRVYRAVPVEVELHVAWLVGEKYMVDRMLHNSGRHDCYCAGGILCLVDDSNRMLSRHAFFSALGLRYQT